MLFRPVSTQPSLPQYLHEVLRHRARPTLAQNVLEAAFTVDASGSARKASCARQTAEAGALLLTGMVLHHRTPDECQLEHIMALWQALGASLYEIRQWK